MIRTVACGISGGVDSAVSAFLLKKKFNVIGVFMKNWDDKDENAKCSVDVDRADSKYVCEYLKIPFVEVNFVKEYWNNVFEETLCSYEKGFTPNPDVLCNKYIKFNSFARFCLEKLDVDAFATGHYARSSFGNFLEKADSKETPLLMRPVDRIKDQTFWLCQVNPKYLSKCMFPLADLTKITVKKIAQEIGLTKTLSRKESMGICFIGKRKFRNFIDSYIEPKVGNFTLLENGKIVGKHEGIHHYTLGQRTGLSLGQNACYTAHMDHETQEIKLVFSSNHPALFMKSMTTDAPHWLCNEYKNVTKFRSKVQFQNKFRSIPCTVNVTDDGRNLQIRIDEWFRCIVPGQYAVLYSPDDEICLGGSQILSSISAWQEGHTEHIEWDLGKFENKYIQNATQIAERNRLINCI